MIEYSLCESLSAERLITLVNKYIDKGWKLQGGIAITGEFYGTLVYAQALTRKKND